VIAAFSAPGSGEVGAVTSHDVFILRLSDRQWIDHRTRISLFPELEGMGFAEAEVVSASAPTHLVFYGYSGSWDYVWMNGSRTASYDHFTAFADFPPAEWGSPLAPPWFDVLGIYAHPDNREGWATVDPSTVCMTTAHTVGPYLAFVSNDGFGPVENLVTIYDQGCSRFVQKSPFADAAPFNATGAPDPFVVQGMAYSDGLYVFLR